MVEAARYGTLEDVKEFHMENEIDIDFVDETFTTASTALFSGLILLFYFYYLKCSMQNVYHDLMAN